jgi:hypothetical protein
VAAGVFLRQMPGALPILRAADGSWVYPQSSDSDDVHLLAAALMGFVFAAFMQLFPRPVAAAAYALNLAVLLVACALVSLDGSLWAAARSGYPLPLLAVRLAHLPVLFWLRPLCRQPAHQSD